MVVEKRLEWPCTDYLGINPSKSHLKGELLKGGKLARKETAWGIATEYEVSYDINEQLDKIMLLLVDKETKIVELIRKFQLNALFMIVVYVENEDVPAMYFRKEFVQFASRIEAEIGFDVYVR